MKVIVTGATGVAGREVVKHCIADRRITKVVVLTRRAVGGDIESHPKAEVVMHQDFAQYPETLLRRLQGAEACLWTIGSRLEKFKDDKELCKKIGADYAIAAARDMCSYLADKTPGGKPFRFIFCSGKFTEWSKKKSLLVMSYTRDVKADAEKGLSEIADTNKDKFSLWILRPAAFEVAEAPTSASKSKKIMANSAESIEPAQLGRAMVKVTCDGWKERVIENKTLVKM